MRHGLRAFLPIVLIALMVQILAPVDVAWVAAIAASDPLAAVQICHSDSNGSSPEDQGGRHAHDACAVCCIGQAGASLDTPPPVFFHAPYRQANAVAWRADTLTLSFGRTGSNAQARAPPFAV
jgi:hypothetical protein